MATEPHPPRPETVPVFQEPGVGLPRHVIPLRYPIPYTLCQQGPSGVALSCGANGDEECCARHPPVFAISSDHPPHKEERKRADAEQLRVLNEV